MADAGNNLNTKPPNSFKNQSAIAANHLPHRNPTQQAMIQQHVQQQLAGTSSQKAIAMLVQQNTVATLEQQGQPGLQQPATTIPMTQKQNFVGALPKPIGFPPNSSIHNNTNAANLAASQATSAGEMGVHSALTQNEAAAAAAMAAERHIQWRIQQEKDNFNNKNALSRGNQHTEEGRQSYNDWMRAYSLSLNNESKDNSERSTHATGASEMGLKIGTKRDGSTPKENTGMEYKRSRLAPAATGVETIDTSEHTQSSQQRGYTKEKQDEPSEQKLNTPMAYLVQQLLCRVDVAGDEPAVVLGPQLVKDAAKSIQNEIGKLVDKERKRVQSMYEDEVISLKSKLSRTAKQDDSTQAGQRTNFEKLKVFAQEQVVTVEEQKLSIDNLKKQVEKSDALVSDLRIKLKNESSTSHKNSETNDSIVRNLVLQLDGGIAIIQRQNTELSSLRQTVKAETADRKLKDETIVRLRERAKQESGPAQSESQQLEIRGTREGAVLKKELEKLKEDLVRERQNGAKSLKAYMRASVYSLKDHQESIALRLQDLEDKA